VLDLTAGVEVLDLAAGVVVDATVADDDALNVSDSWAGVDCFVANVAFSMLSAVPFVDNAIVAAVDTLSIAFEDDGELAGTFWRVVSFAEGVALPPACTDVEPAALA
jgi:hypothetical protein